MSTYNTYDKYGHTTAQPSPLDFDDLVPFIEDVAYPALREDIIQEAQRNHAPSRLALFLNWIDGRLYGSLSDVEAAFRHITHGLKGQTITQLW
ncbi:MAG: hypothetical protein C0514_08325 [Candidatus Puniceispirillum sp.]|nr:hypothetical protein [Candidatus Puniceispirillum sp.]